MPALDQERISKILGSKIVRPENMTNQQRLMMAATAPFVRKEIPPLKIADDELGICQETNIPVRVMEEAESAAKTSRCLKGMQHLSVNSHTIKGNIKNGTNEPPLAIRGYGDTCEYAHEVALVDKDGKPVAMFFYRPDKPLKCGAKVFFATVDPNYTLVRKK